MDINKVKFFFKGINLKYPNFLTYLAYSVIILAINYIYLVIGVQSLFMYWHTPTGEPDLILKLIYGIGYVIAELIYIFSVVFVLCAEFREIMLEPITPKYHSFCDWVEGVIQQGKDHEK